MEKLTLTVPGQRQARKQFDEVWLGAIHKALCLSGSLPKAHEHHTALYRLLVIDLIGDYDGDHDYNAVAHYVNLMNPILENISYCRMDTRLVTGYVHTTLLGERSPIKYRHIGHVCGATSEPGSIYSSDTSSISQWPTWKPVSECPGCVIRHALEDIVDLMAADVMRIVSELYVNSLIDAHGNTDMHITGCKGDVLILEDHSYHVRQLPALL